MFWGSEGTLWSVTTTHQAYSQVLDPAHPMLLSELRQHLSGCPATNAHTGLDP